ncbi:MAG TPA: hypothetical protein VIT65_20395 [Microlunatus sp.]
MSTAAPSPADPSSHPDAAAPHRHHDGSEVADTREVVRRQKDRFGGMKFGACFFGWLTATGTAVLLTALLTAAGAALGLGQNLPATQTSADAQTIGLVGGIVLAVVVLVAYLAGGYVAGRMARFNGVKQGLGVWLWAIIISVVVAVVSLVAGSQFNVLATLNGLPRIPINEGTLTTAGVIAAVVLMATALIGAVLGGLAGMRFHRRVDHSDLSPTN